MLLVKKWIDANVGELFGKQGKIGKYYEVQNKRK